MENIQKHASPLTRKLLLGNKIDAKGKKVRDARAAGRAAVSDARPPPAR